MKILTLDIETRPHLAFEFDLWSKSPIGLPQVVEFGSVFAFAAKWHGSKRVEFYSDFHHGHEKMVERAHHLLSECDVLVTYNGRRFDVPKLNREFWLRRMGPPAPYQHVDLYQVIKRNFGFASNKLQHISQQLEIGSKVKHEGMILWKRCIEGDPKAWATMKRYNIGDVRLTEELYDLARPWINNHPHHGLYSGEADVCSNCGSANLERRGFALTAVSMYQRFRCNDCGRWSRGAKAVARVDTRGVA